MLTACLSAHAFSKPVVVLATKPIILSLSKRLYGNIVGMSAIFLFILYTIKCNCVCVFVLTPQKTTILTSIKLGAIDNNLRVSVIREFKTSQRSHFLTEENGSELEGKPVPVLHEQISHDLEQYHN